MIINTDDRLPVGARFSCGRLTDADGEVHYNVPILVLREATLTEYLEYCRQVSARVVHPAMMGQFAYEVSTD